MIEEQHKKKIIPWKILVVDDSRLDRSIVKNVLSKLNMMIIEAYDGLHGLEMFKQDQFDLVLVDIVMPNLDGFEFIQRVKDLLKDRFIPIILMTGSEDLNSKIKGLSIGADDYLLKPINEQELKARVLSLLRLKKAHTELYEKNLIIMNELEVAKSLQQRIIPKDFSDIDYPVISGRYLPIEDVGGDFFDYYRLSRERIGILIADVTGHGIPAALVMTMSKMIFSIYSSQYHSTSKLLSKVNSQMRGVLLDSQYVTAFYLIFNPADSTLLFTNAGHNRVLLYRARNDNIIALDTDGLFVGIKDDTYYEEKSIKIETGDRLFLYTDGISELKNSENKDFGEKGIAKYIKNNKDLKGDNFCESLINEISAYCFLEDRNDDIAFLNIEF